MKKENEKLAEFKRENELEMFLSSEQQMRILGGSAS
jgi:hypothetical protein